MAANPQEDLVTVEVNGVPLQARRGTMLIEVTDEAGIQVPRFCYHKKLSVAANCRMCLVEVEKAPKPLPACATPVADGMKVYTKSPKALAAQKGTMEFLLINHPLDCPICDQGGECELQDLAMGYGEDVSRYSEAKRVVKDKDIGPLIQTDMTRCIHCTRCVRFGTEIAGLRELGATGRGESMQIGTFIERSVDSELSGNVIDLCPVGALTAKPSRYSARAWELTQHASLAPHDSLGSNLFLHALRGVVKRAVPRENEGINETWISDRDRFGYEGLNAEERLRTPMLKRDGRWVAVDWESALQHVAETLRAQDPEQIGALASAHATLEELYLFQRLMRGLGVAHIDHRLRQADFRDQGRAPLFPWLGQAIADLERAQAVLLVGANPRKDQPIAGLRLRKAALAGASVMTINPRSFDFRFEVAHERIVAPSAMVAALAEVVVAALRAAEQATPPELAVLVEGIEPSAEASAMATRLREVERATVLLGNLAEAHPQLTELRALAGTLAELTGARFGYLPAAANSAGAWLAGVLPHRGPGGAALEQAGLDAAEMLGASARKAYVLMGVEPEWDANAPAAAVEALSAADCVVMLGSYASAAARDYADVLLPIAPFSETSGTYVNAEGRWQSTHGAVPPLGEARPGWKVLRVLGNLLDLRGFDQTSSETVREELKACFPADLSFDNRVSLADAEFAAAQAAPLERAGSVAIYRLDPVVRRAASLQATGDGSDVALRLHPDEAEALGLREATQVTVEQDGHRATLPLILDERIARGCAWLPAGTDAVTGLGAAVGPMTLEGS